MSTFGISFLMALACNNKGIFGAGDSGIDPNDTDGDGYVYPEDCNDDDPNINPGMAEVTCNQVDENCNGLHTDDHPDNDNDGYNICTDLSIYPMGGDCDDSNAAVNPGAIEICDGMDTDCDGVADDGGLWYPDNDGDGYGDSSATGVACDSSTHGFVADNTDCLDTSVNTHPGNGENEADPTLCMRDKDKDGYGKSNPVAGVDAGTDCDDNAPNTYPGAAEEESKSDCMKDYDMDGFGDDSPASSMVLAGSDCDDGEEGVFPGAYDICDDGVDTDCDGSDDLYCPCPEELRGYWWDSTHDEEWVMNDDGTCAWLKEGSYLDPWGERWDDVIETSDNYWTGLSVGFLIDGYLTTDLEWAVARWSVDGFVVTDVGGRFDASSINSTNSDTIEIHGGPMLIRHDEATGAVEAWLYAEHGTSNAVVAYAVGTMTSATELQMTVTSGDILYEAGNSTMRGTCGFWSFHDLVLTPTLVPGDENWREDEFWCLKSWHWCDEFENGNENESYDGDQWGLDLGQRDCPEGDAQEFTPTTSGYGQCVTDGFQDLEYLGELFDWFEMAKAVGSKSQQLMILKQQLDRALENDELGNTDYQLGLTQGIQAIELLHMEGSTFEQDLDMLHAELDDPETSIERLETIGSRTAKTLHTHGIATEPFPEAGPIGSPQSRAERAWSRAFERALREELMSQ